MTELRYEIYENQEPDYGFVFRGWEGTLEDAILFIEENDNIRAVVKLNNEVVYKNY